MTDVSITRENIANSFLSFNLSLNTRQSEMTYRYDEHVTALSLSLSVMPAYDTIRYDTMDYINVRPKADE